MKNHHLFVSHSWSYGDDYDRLISLLRQRKYFRFQNYSVPKDDPIHNAGNEAELTARIRQKMAPCGVILVMAGVYATYRKWIKIEIELAKDGFTNRKPILAIKPRGNTRVSRVVADAAAEIANWNTESIVAAIRRLD